MKYNSSFGHNTGLQEKLDTVQAYKRNWTQHVNIMPRNRLHRVTKAAHQKAEGTREDH